MTEEQKQYRVKEDTILTEEYRKYRGQVGTHVSTVVEDVINLEFDDGKQLCFALEELEEVQG